VQHTPVRLIPRLRPLVFTVGFFFAALTAIGCASQRPPAFPGTASAPNPSALGEIKAFLDKTLNTALLETTLWGIDVRSIDRNEQIYTNNPDVLLIPASTLKIITLAVASQALGWDDRFETTLFTNGHIERNVLHGDLIVRGSGDPTIDIEILTLWAKRLRMQGIHRVTGNIIGDDRLSIGQDLKHRATVSPPQLGFGWSWDDVAFGFSAPVGPLQYQKNVVEIQITPGHTINVPAELTIQTTGSGLKLVNKVITTSATKPNHIQLHRIPNTPNLVMSGSIGLGSSAVVRSVAIANPTSFFVQALLTALEAEGIVVLGDAVDIDRLTESQQSLSSNQLNIVLKNQSEPLSTIAVDMMKQSQNLFAESIFRRLGVSFGDTGSAIATKLLADWGIQRNRAIVVDGSGLSRYNYLTASALTDILIRLHQSERDKSLFLATLPIANKDGTLRTRFAKTTSAGNARAKTGSMSHVQALAGYVTTADNEQLAFSILANNFSADPTDVVTAIDSFVSTLATMSRGDS